jgi:YVTN family beta-propeller protein
MKNPAIIIFVTLILVSCTKEPVIQPNNITIGGGVFVLNEGNFNAGNGSLSFFSYDSLKIFNDLFYEVNGRPLGDVPNSMIINADNAYIVVNNSGKIEVVDRLTLAWKATITGLISPRNIAIVNDNKAYVSSLYSDSVAIIDLTSKSVSGYINMRRSSESIVVSGAMAYIANWIGGDEVMVINTLIDKVVDSVKVGIEPESMVIDRYRRIWVLCNGGWARENFAELDMINTFDNSVEQNFVFPSKENSPSCLQIDVFGQTLYYLENGVRQMDINSYNLPATTLISESGANFYKMAVNPANGDIFVTDVIDYLQKGFLLHYKNDGSFITKYATGIIPGSLCFNLRYYTSSL